MQEARAVFENTLQREVAKLKIYFHCQELVSQSEYFLTINQKKQRRFTIHLIILTMRLILIPLLILIIYKIMEVYKVKNENADLTSQNFCRRL
jgi:hypothetical protein